MELTGKPTCSGVKKSGSPCTSTALGPTGFCGWHDPLIPAETKTKWAKAGGDAGSFPSKMATVLEMTDPGWESYKPDLSSAKSCRDYLEELAGRVQAGTLPPSVARALREIVDSSRELAALELEVVLLAKLEDPAMLALLLAAKQAEGKLAHEVGDHGGS